MESGRVVMVLNGPNLNLLGEREPEIYGSTTLPQLEQLCRDAAARHKLSVEARQSNHEGVLIDWAHEARHGFVGLIINAGGYSHTSIALRDALAALSCVKVEVHISDLLAREAFRHHSYLTDVCDHAIVGQGVQGYVAALDFVAGRVSV